MDKSVKYDLLVLDRKQCRLCAGDNIANPAEVDPNFDSNEVGPWSRWQGNLNAKLMVVGQDWGDQIYFKANRGLDAARNPTNEMLRMLIREQLGIEFDAPGDLGRNGVLFFTNAMLCLKKEGGLQGTVQKSWFSNCIPFLKRQIELVSPRLLVCLGERAYRSVAAAFEFRAGNFRKAVESETGVVLPNSTRVFARYHCGKRILNTHRNELAQREDWHRLAKFVVDGVPASEAR